MAEQVKSVGDLDTLPDPILCHILSFLPIKEAVRTSILSPKWRYLFDSMSVLNFDSSLSGLSRTNVACFKNFVDRFLFYADQLGLESFRVKDLSWDDDYSCLNGWICATLCRGVKEIVICSAKPLRLPSFLFTSKSLVTLEIDNCGEIKVPTSDCLPNLKTLHLKNIKFSDGGSFHRLLSGCLALEKLVITQLELPKNMTKVGIHNLSLKHLTLEFCHGDFMYVVEINAPSLVSLKCDDVVVESYTLSNMEYLEKAILGITQLEEIGTYNRVRECGAIHLLQAIGNVRSLVLWIEQPDALFRTHLESVLTFHNLVKFVCIHQYKIGKELWLVKFLHCLPNLKTFILHMDELEPEEGFSTLPDKVPSCLLSHLKEMKITGFCEHIRLFEIAGYFLDHASVLEKLEIEMKSPITKDEQLRITQKLLELQRTSRCRVLVAL